MFVDTAASIARVGAARAVVEHTGDDGPIDVAGHELHQHFLADAGREHAAPVGASHCSGHAHPGARLFVARRVVGAARMGKAVARTTAALPVKLDADSMVAIGVHRLARGAHDNGRLSHATTSYASSPGAMNYLRIDDKMEDRKKLYQLLVTAARVLPLPKAAPKQS